MRNTAIFCFVSVLLAAALLISPPVATSASPTKSPLEIEKPAIDKLARLSASEHAMILFSLGNYITGYATDGRVEWIETGNTTTLTCGWPHPALSHNGNYVAFIKGSSTVSKACRIVVFNISDKSQHELIETDDDPGEISWAWDDSEIVYWDHGLNAVSIRGGKHLLLPPAKLKIDKRQFSHWVWYPMQWAHNDMGVAIELSTDVPIKNSDETKTQSVIAVVKDGVARIIDNGSQPAVSPLRNRLAYYHDGAIATVNFDGTDRQVVSSAPRQLFFMHEELFESLVWSPDAKQLFFGTIVSEDRRDKLYLLDVKSGHRNTFLSRTSMTIRGWHRSAGFPMENTHGSTE